MSISFRLMGSCLFVLLLNLASRNSEAQEILFTNNAAYLDPTTNPPTPRLMMNGYSIAVVKNNVTYKYVGAVLSNSYATYNDVYNPPANAPGTTFCYGQNAAFGTSPTSFAWNSDVALPVKTISTDPSNPTFITVSFYLVSNTGAAYNSAPFATYCFMTYIAAGKVMTSPAGGPYFVVVPPGGVGMNTKDKPATLPVPPADPLIPRGFWENRPSPLHLEANGRTITLQNA